MPLVGFTAEADGGSPAATPVVFYGRPGFADFWYSGVFSSGVFADYAGYALFTTSVDADPLAQLMPGSSAGRYQWVGWRVTRDDSAIDSGIDGTQPITVSRSLNRHIQTAELPLVRTPGDTLWGPLSGFQATGTDDLDIVLRYKQSDGDKFSESLITGGVAQVSEHSITVPRTVALSVSDRGARYADALVSYQLSAGAGKTRSQLVRELAVLAGVPTAQLNLPNIDAGTGGTISTAGTVKKAVDLANGDWLNLAQAHAEVKGAHLLWNRDGEFTAVFDAPERGLPEHSWVIGPEDIVWAINGEVTGIRSRPATAPYTSVTIRGSKQVERDTCGDSSLVLRQLVTDTFDLNPLSYKQTTGGSYTAISADATSQLATFSQTVLTLRCDEIVTERTRSESIRNIQSARYVRDISGAITTYREVYVENNADGVPGWLYRNDRRMKDTLVFVSRLYDGSGNMIQERKTTWGWYNPRRSFKERASGSDSWETATANQPYYDLGNGDAVVYTSEKFQKISERVEKWFVGDNGYVLSNEVTEYGFGRVKGTLYLYQDGEYGQREETFQRLKYERNDYQIVKEGVARRSTWEKGIGHDSAAYSQEVYQGAPPAAKTADFSNARRFEQQEMEATCSLPTSSARLTRVLPSLYWETAETEEELRDICTRVLMQGMAVEVEWTMLPNPRIQEGQTVLLVGPNGSGLSHIVLVRDVTFSGSQWGPKVMTLRGLAYPDVSEL